MQGRVVLVTGASRGIGQAILFELARRGASVIGTATSESGAQAIAKALADAGLAGEGMALDVTDPAQCDLLVDAIVKKHGRIDVLVNNAGISQRSRVADTSLAVDRRIMEVNYFGVVGLTRAVLPVFRRQRGGRIVVISSLVGLISTPLRSTYAASKHALHGFFEALRAEEYDAGVRILMVCPGAIATEVSLHALSADGAEHGVMDPLQATGMPADACARRILDALEGGQEQLIVAGRERLAIPLYKLFPGAYRRLVRRLKVT